MQARLAGAAASNEDEEYLLSSIFDLTNACHKVRHAVDTLGCGHVLALLECEAPINIIGFILLVKAAMCACVSRA